MATFTKQQEKLIDPMWDMIEASESFTFNDVKDLVATLPVKITNWLKVRDVMASIAHELGYVRDNTDLTVERYIKKVAVQKPAPKKEPALPSSTPRPKAGTVCAEVWATCDTYKDLPRKEVIQKCVNAGINAATARTQYQRWFSAQ